jgi:hypothetical protein
MTTLEDQAVRAVAADASTPEWARGVLTQWPSPDSDANASVLQHVFDSSYLDFLKEQIQLAPRGQAWSKILQRRFDALRHLAGTELISVRVQRGEYLFIAEVRADSFEVVHAELDGVDGPASHRGASQEISPERKRIDSPQAPGGEDEGDE